MQMRRFDGSSDWVAPAAAIETTAFSVLTCPAPAIGCSAFALLGSLAALVLALSFAS